MSDSLKDASVANPPSNSALIQSIDSEIDKLSKFKDDPSMGYKGERVLEDAKRILQDEKQLIIEKNSGENVQKLLRDGYFLALGLQNDQRFGSLFDNWGSILASVSKSGDWTEIYKSVGSLASDLRDTESFIRLLTEIQKTVKLLIAEGVDKATTKAQDATEKVADKAKDAANFAERHDIIEKDSKDEVKDTASDAKDKIDSVADKTRSIVHDLTDVSKSSAPISAERYELKKEKNQRKLRKELEKTLRSLSENSTYKFLVAKAESAGSKLQSSGEKTKDTVIATLESNPQVQVVTDDIKNALQDIVGKDVDVSRFFEYTRFSIDYILADSSYAGLLDETRTLLTDILEHPESLNSEKTQQQLQKLADRFEEKLDELYSNPYITVVRAEGEKIVNAIKNDPTSNKLVEDLKTLIGHVQSNKPGQLLDPELLQEMRAHIVPLLLEHLADISVPGYTDVTDTSLGKFEVTVQNINVAAKSLVPDNLKVKFKYNLDAHPLTLSASNQRILVKLRANDIQLQIKDIDWSYKRLSTPHLHDCGLASLYTEGRGVDISLKMEFEDLSKSETTSTGSHLQNKESIRVLEGTCNIDKLKMEFKESKHDKLYEVLFTNKIKHQIEEIVVKKMYEFATVFNRNVYVLYNETLINKEKYGERLKGSSTSLTDSITNLSLGPSSLIKDQLKSSAKELVFGSEVKVESKTEEKKIAAPSE
eukprot:TRINITY_DN4019_c0_g1_i2.p1 TRINITY_DN4019_c0_g1~~TRINITY_DN4019_c0_g1_i2.p1  ORF type:complete len:707 (+),score=191.82 TRINITY_DN4019_c0_g1_i2:141-2261(+)